MSDVALEPSIADLEPLAGEIPMEGPGEPATDPAAVVGLFSAGRRALTAGLVMTVTLIAFEALAISTVMPVVAAELGGLDLYGWVFSVFFLGNLIGIVVVGGLIDRGGLIRPLAVGLGLFSIGLVVGGLAPSMPVLVAGRLFQGLGAGAIPPIAYVSIGRALPEDLRPQMFAVLSTAWVLPGVIGPAIAGVIAEHASWRVVFLGLLPLIVLAAVVILPAIRAAVPSGAELHRGEAKRGAAKRGEANRGEANRRELHRGSVIGSAETEMRRRLPLALVLALGAALLVAGLTSGTLVPGGPVALGGILLVLPTFRRLSPPGTLRAARGLPAAILLRGVLTFAFFCADAYVPLALQHWRGLSPSVAGIALTGATLSWAVGSWIQARRYEALGARRLVRSGFAVVVVGIAGFALVLVPAVPVAVGLAAWAVAGLGMGLAYAPLSLTVLREAAPGSEGAAASGLQLSDVLGTALGTGIGGALVAIGARAGLDPWVGLLGAFAIGAAVGLAGLVVAGRLDGRLDGRRARSVG
jgi:MFS family permease